MVTSWVVTFLGIFLAVLFSIPLVTILWNRNLLDDPTTRLVISACIMSAICGLFLTFIGLLNVVLFFSESVNMMNSYNVPSLSSTQKTAMSSMSLPDLLCVPLLYFIIIFVIVMRVTSVFLTIDNFYAVVQTRNYRKMMEVWAPKMVTMARAGLCFALFCGFVNLIIRLLQIESDEGGNLEQPIAAAVNKLNTSEDSSVSDKIDLSNTGNVSSIMSKGFIIPVHGWHSSSSFFSFMAATSDLTSVLLDLGTACLNVHTITNGLQQERRMYERGIYDLTSPFFVRLKLFKHLCGVTLASSALDIIFTCLGITARLTMQYAHTWWLMMARLLLTMLETWMVVLSRTPLREAIWVGCRSQCRCRPSETAYRDRDGDTRRPTALVAVQERQLSSPVRY